MTMTKAAVLLLFISCLYMFAFSSSSVTMVSGSNTRRMESVKYGGGGYGGGGYGGSHGGGGSGYAGGDDEGAHRRHGGSHDRGDDHGGDYSDRDGNDRHATNGSEQLFFMSALVIMVSMSVAISLGYV